MKRSVLVCAVAAVTLAVCVGAQSLQANELEQMAASGRPIRVFVGDFKNESGQPQVVSEEFRKEFEKALLDRRSVVFEIAKSPAESDVQISGIIESYQYLEKDPIRPSGTTATLILDAVTSENFVEMIVDFTVVDTGTGKTVWKKTISSFVKRMMTPEESIPVIYDKVSRTFLWKSFGKGR